MFLQLALAFVVSAISAGHTIEKPYSSSYVKTNLNALNITRTVTRNHDLEFNSFLCISPAETTIRSGLVELVLICPGLRRRVERPTEVGFRAKFGPLLGAGLHNNNLSDLLRSSGLP